MGGGQTRSSEIGTRNSLRPRQIDRGKLITYVTVPSFKSFRVPHLKSRQFEVTAPFP